MGLSITRLIKAIGKAIVAVIASALLVIVVAETISAATEVPLLAPFLLILSCFTVLVKILY